MPLVYQKIQSIEFGIASLVHHIPHKKNFSLEFMFNYFANGRLAK